MSCDQLAECMHYINDILILLLICHEGILNYVIYIVVLYHITGCCMMLDYAVLYIYILYCVIFLTSCLEFVMF